VLLNCREETHHPKHQPTDELRRAKGTRLMKNGEQMPGDDAKKNYPERGGKEVGLDRYTSGWPLSRRRVKISARGLIDDGGGIQAQH